MPRGVVIPVADLVVFIAPVFDPRIAFVGLESRRRHPERFGDEAKFFGLGNLGPVFTPADRRDRDLGPAGECGAVPPFLPSERLDALAQRLKNLALCFCPLHLSIVRGPRR